MSGTQIKHMFSRANALLLLAVVLAGYIFWSIDLDTFVAAISDYNPIFLLATILVFVLLNLLASVRLHYLLGCFRINIPYIESVKASVAGYLSGLIVFQLVGQLLGRRHYLRSHGVEPSMIVLLSFYERVVGLLTGVSLSAVGVVYLYRHLSTLMPVYDVNFEIMGVAIILVIIVNTFASNSAFEKSLLSSIFSTRSFARFAITLGQTLLIQGITIYSFFIVLKGMDLNVDTIDILAAAAVVSFVASLPISINGWGVREIASIYMFGLVGVDAPEALLASIIIGASSTISVLLLSPLLSMAKQKLILNQDETLMTDPLESHQGVMSLPFIDSNKALAWIFSLGVAALMFFQVHVRVGGGVLSVNLADPLAVMTLGYFVLVTIQSGKLPNWKCDLITPFALAVSAVLLLGFAHGVWSFGVTDWALKNRLLGWIVLIGYALAGHFIVSVAGNHGLRRIAETFILSAVVIIIFTYAWRLNFLSEFSNNSTFAINNNFDGFSSNRNAFSFLLLCVLSLGMSFLPVYEKRGVANRWLWALAIIALGIWLSKSRTALVIVITMGFAVPFFWGKYKSVYLRLFAYSSVLILLSAFSFDIINASISGVNIVKEFFFSEFTKIQSVNVLDVSLLNITKNIDALVRLDDSGSDSERWALLLRAFEMWMEYPLFGKGLGALMNEKATLSGNPALVHNSILWLLSEMGVIGTLVFISFFFYLFKFFYKNARSHRKAYAVCGVLLLGIFAMFSQVHEVLYQRPLWFLLGALVSLPLSLRSYESQASQEK